MVITVDGEKRVTSVPAAVPQGTNLNQVTVIAPFINSTCVLKVRPPSQEWIEDIICQPALSYEKECLIWTANIPDKVTAYSGRADYQLTFTGRDGEKFPTFAGSITISRGIPVNMPESAEDLSNYTLEQIYTMLSNVTALYNITSSHGERLDKNDSEILNLNEFTGLGENTLIFAENLAEAVNKLNGTIIGEEGTVTIPVSGWSDDKKYIINAVKTEGAYFFKPLTRDDEYTTVKANTHISVDGNKIIFDVEEIPKKDIQLSYYVTYSNMEISKYENPIEPPVFYYDILKDLHNCDEIGEPILKMMSSDTVIIKFKANYGYEFTDEISVENATYSWTPDTGTLVLQRPTDTIKIRLYAEKALFDIIYTTKNVRPLENNRTVIWKNEMLSVTFMTVEGHKLPDSVSVSGADHVWDVYNNIGTLVLSNPIDDVYIDVEGVLLAIYNISLNLSGIISDGDNPASILEKSSVVLKFYNESGYEFPDDISVINANLDYYNKNTGEITISDPIGDVYINIDGIQTIRTYVIYVFKTNIYSWGDNPTEISTGESKTLRFYTSSGATLPDDVIVNGANYNWNSENGELVIYNPVSDVNIEIVGISKMYNITVNASHILPNLNNPTMIAFGEEPTLTFTSEDGYKISSNNPTVINANIKAWNVNENQMSADLTINNPSGDVEISFDVIESGDVG